MKIAIGASSVTRAGRPALASPSTTSLATRSVCGSRRIAAVELDEPLGGSLLALVQLGEQRVRLDARGIELDRATQVRLGGGGALAMDLRQPEAHAHVVAVAGRRSDVEQALERRHRGVGVAAGERDLAGQEQRVRLVVGATVAGTAPRARPSAWFASSTSPARSAASAARGPVAGASPPWRGDDAAPARGGCGGRYCLS